LSADSLSVAILGPEKYNEWDQFVCKSEQGDVFCYSWWLDAATKSNFKLYALLSNGGIVAGFPAALDTNNKINEPPLTRTLGVLYIPQLHLPEDKRSEIERKWLMQLLEYIPLRDFVQICTHHNFNDWLPFRWKGLKQTTRYTYLLNYHSKTVSDLKTNLSRGKKSNINRAVRNGLRVEESDDPELLYNFTELSYKRQGLKFKFPYPDFKLLDEAARNKGSRLILKAADIKGRTHAAVYIVFTDKSAYYLLGGSDPDCRKMGGHTLALWEAVKFFCGKADYFNFGGSDIKPVEEHIKGFGGTMTPYFNIYNDRLMHYTEIRYHLREMLFHLKRVAMAFRFKYLANRK